MLVYKGNFKNYLSENEIGLCYVIKDNDIELRRFESYIKTYDIGEDGNLTLHQVAVSAKKVYKRDKT
jgi:hypothetical protein